MSGVVCVVGLGFVCLRVVEWCELGGVLSCIFGGWWEFGVQFIGEGFRGIIPRHFGLRGKDAIAQLVTLSGMHSYSLMDFHGEISANREVIFVHFQFWKSRSFAREGVSEAQRAALIDAIRKAWSEVSPGIPLPDF